MIFFVLKHNKNPFFNKNIPKWSKGPLVRGSLFHELT